MQALARNSDPITSHIAAETVEKTGSAKHQRDKCLAAVRDYPGRTSAEIASLLGIDRYIPARRLPELRSVGLVRNGGTRICGVQGTPAMTWGPTDRLF